MSHDAYFTCKIGSSVSKMIELIVEESTDLAHDVGSVSMMCVVDVINDAMNHDLADGIGIIISNRCSGYDGM